MANQHTKSERHTITRLVRLTPAEDARARELARAYRCSVVEVLRAGLGAFGREHIRVKRDLGREVDEERASAIQAPHDQDKAE